MAGYYYKLATKTWQSIGARVNAFFSKKFLGTREEGSDNSSSLIDCYKNCILLPQKFLVFDEGGKLPLKHIIPATYKNPFVHLKFLDVLRGAASGKGKAANKIDKAFVWGNNWSTGYYHFVGEDLPKLIYMKKIGIPIYTWKTNIPRWRSDLENLFGVESTAIAKPVHVNELYYIANNRIKTNEHKFSTLHPDLSNAMAKALEELVAGWEITDSKKITWISRKYTRDRNIVNETECIKQLQKEGLNIEILYPEKLTVKQQITAVYNTWWIIGPHGAGLTNIVFSSKANIIELGPKQRINNAFVSMAASFNRQYAYLAVDSLSKVAKNRSNFYIPGLQDFTSEIIRLINGQQKQSGPLPL